MDAVVIIIFCLRQKAARRKGGEGCVTAFVGMDATGGNKRLK